MQYSEAWKHHGRTETPKHRIMEAQTHGSTEEWKHGSTEAQKHGSMEEKHHADGLCTSTRIALQRYLLHRLETSLPVQTKIKDEFEEG
jgi:hypothetical protein